MLPGPLPFIPTGCARAAIAGLGTQARFIGGAVLVFPSISQSTSLVDRACFGGAEVSPLGYEGSATRSQPGSSVTV